MPLVISLLCVWRVRERFPFMRNGFKFLNQVESKTSHFEIVFKKYYLSRAKYIRVKLRRSLLLLTTKNLSQFHASFHIDPKFPITFQQLDLSRSSRECFQLWRAFPVNIQTTLIYNTSIQEPMGHGFLVYYISLPYFLFSFCIFLFCFYIFYIPSH